MTGIWWKYIDFVLAGLVIVLVLGALFRKNGIRVCTNPTLGRQLLWLGAILLLAFSIRFAQVPGLYSNTFLMDEYRMARLYTGAVMQDWDRLRLRADGSVAEPGADDSFLERRAGQLTHSALLDSWYRVFGLSVLSARSFSIVLGCIGILATFLFAARLRSPQVSLWAGVILAWSRAGSFIILMMALPFITGNIRFQQTG